MQKLCSRCLKSERTKGQRWCKSCRAEYMRNWRKSKGGYSALSPEQKHRSSTRAYANVYQYRGKILPPKNCADCPMPPTEKHHSDYNKPLSVVWLCRDCHIKRTTNSRRKES